MKISTSVRRGWDCGMIGVSWSFIPADDEPAFACVTIGLFFLLFSIFITGKPVQP